MPPNAAAATIGGFAQKLALARKQIEALDAKGDAATPRDRARLEALTRHLGKMKPDLERAVVTLSGSEPHADLLRALGSNFERVAPMLVGGDGTITSDLTDVIERSPAAREGTRAVWLERTTGRLAKTADRLRAAGHYGAACRLHRDLWLLGAEDQHGATSLEDEVKRYLSTGSHDLAQASLLDLNRFVQDKGLEPSDTHRRLEGLIRQGSSTRVDFNTEIERAPRGHGELIEIGRNLVPAELSERLESVGARLRASEGKFQALTREHVALSKLAQELMKHPDGAQRAEQTMSKLGELQSEMMAVVGEIGPAHAEGELAMAELRDGLMASSFISEGEAKDLASTIPIHESFDQTRTQMRETMAEFIRLTDGRGMASMTRVLPAEDGRAYTKPIGTVHLPPNPMPACIFHEMAHHIELESKELNAAALGWLKSRAHGAEPTKLSVLLRDPGYKDHEVAYAGDFVHPYVGKVYPGGDTEAISTGVERFCDRGAMLVLFQRDREHFYLALGALRS